VIVENNRHHGDAKTHGGREFLANEHEAAVAAHVDDGTIGQRHFGAERRRISVAERPLIAGLNDGPRPIDRIAPPRIKMQLRHVKTNDAVFWQRVADDLRIGALRRQDPAQRFFFLRLHLRELRFAVFAARIRGRHALEEFRQCRAGVGDDMNIGPPGGDRLLRIDIDPDQANIVVAAPFHDRMEKTRTDRERDVDAGPEIVADLHGLSKRMTDVERTKAMLAHDHGRLQHFGELAQFALGAERAAAGEDRRVAGAAEQGRGACDGLGVGLYGSDGLRRPSCGSRRRASGSDIGRNFNHHGTAAAAVQLAKRRVYDVRGVGR
jgi:hypothetical protein